MKTTKQESLEVMNTAIGRARRAVQLCKELSHLKQTDEDAATEILLEMEQMLEDDEDAAREDGE